MKLSKQDTKFQTIVIISARGNGELVRVLTTQWKGLYSQYILKAELAVFSDKWDMKYQSKKKKKKGMKDDSKLFLLNNYKWNRYAINWESNQHYLFPFIFIHSLKPGNLILLQTLEINWTFTCLPACLRCSILLLWSLRKLFPLNFHITCHYPYLAKSLCCMFLSQSLFVIHFHIHFHWFWYTKQLTKLCTY